MGARGKPAGAIRDDSVLPGEVIAVQPRQVARARHSSIVNVLEVESRGFVDQMWGVREWSQGWPKCLDEHNSMELLMP